MSPRGLLCNHHDLSQFSSTFQPHLSPQTSSHFLSSYTVSSADKSESLPSLLGSNSQGPLVSGGTTWAQALDDEDGAHHDAYEAHSQPQGADHSLCQLWHRGWNLRFCKSEVVKLRIQSVGSCACVWDGAGGVVFILQRLRAAGLGKRGKYIFRNTWSVENKLWTMWFRG